MSSVYAAFAVALVALLAEGVDRNPLSFLVMVYQSRVALLAEGVDRNEPLLVSMVVSDASPSSRRAWIEISKLLVNMLPLYVALLAEGVDRNAQ